MGDMNHLEVMHICGKELQTLGRFCFRHVPRIGEWVDIELEGAIRVFEVAQIAHSAKGNGINVFVIDPRPATAASRELYGTLEEQKREEAQP